MTIVDNVKKNLDVKMKKGSRKKPNTFEDVKKLASAYNTAMVFKHHPGRQYESFPKFKECILDAINTQKFRDWMKSKELEFNDL